MHYLPVKEVYRTLQSSEKGLETEEAKIRLSKFGFNELKESHKISPWQLFLNQFKNAVIWILVGAVLISAFIGEFVDAIVIVAILVMIAVLGFVQEYRAEKAIEALKKLSSLKATVLRNNEKIEIDSKEVVPGDILILETGNKIPADARLVESFNFQTQEAALTGESLPLKKSIDVLDEKTPLADRSNMIFSGTLVVSGRAKAVVASTGMQTEIGKIAKLIQDVEQEQTPLQKKLDQLGKLLGTITVGIAVIIFVVGILVHEAGFIEMLVVAVSIAVAAIPEGLPAVITISLAIGTKKMLKKNALIRKLTSVETLGSTTVICSDKTGTLTMNQMTVKKIFANGKIIEITGAGYETKGEFLHNSKPVEREDIELLLTIGALNNNSELKDGSVIGDPTEGALIVSAAKIGINKEVLAAFERIDEIEFTSERKIMTTIHKRSNNKFAYTKGAPEILLRNCSQVLVDGKPRKITGKDKDKILQVNAEFANSALRVLGFAYKPLKDKNPEKDLIFVGLQGMIDPPREEVKTAIEKCKKAGIKVIMITGDNEATAKAVGRDIGLEGKSINGQDLEKIKDLHDIVEEISIFARVNPEHKIKIVEALRKRGHIVAMTGDGVNDAPALKQADIGIAMGISGTDVSKEASAMILIDDNFASIVNAVEEGRGIYDNIKKYVQFLLSSNFGEVLVIFLAIILGMPLPLIAIQILWMNLVTDGLPALALSVDPNGKKLMERNPRKPNEHIISKFMSLNMIITGIVMTITTLIIFKEYKEINLVYAQTMAFSMMVMLEMFNVLNCRSEFESAFNSSFFKNKWLWLSIFSSLLLQVLVVYGPMAKYFKTYPITINDWIIIIVVSSSVLIVGEIIKFIRKIRASSFCNIHKKQE